MAEVGIGQVARLQLDLYDDTTVATLYVLSPPDDTGARRRTDISTNSSDGRKTWTGVVPAYDVGGLWYQVWTVTGMGYGRIVHEVPVIPDQLEVRAARVYATSADLAAHTRDAPPPDVERMLVAASREVDTLLFTARYPVDADGYPTQVLHRAALRDAVCELVAWWIDTGDESGALGIYGSLSAGSISVGRATAQAAAGANATIARQVRDILWNAGLTGRPGVRA